MSKVLKTVDKTMAICGIVLEAVLASGVIISVFLRYVFSISFVWSEELLTMVFVATTFLGAALGLRQGEHIAISQFQDAFPKKLKKTAKVIVQIVIVAVSVFMIYYSVIIIRKVGGVPSPATGILRGVYYSLIPVSFGLTTLYGILNLLTEFLPIPPPDKSYQEEESAAIEMGGL